MGESDLREVILEAAGAKLRSAGLRGVNVSRVAAQARVSRPTVYRHVGGSAEIVRGLIAREVARYFDAVSPVMDRPEPIVERFVEALRFTVAFARENSVLQSLLMEESDTVLPLLTLEARPILEQAVELLTPYLFAARQSGEIHVDDLPAAAEWAARMTLSLVLTPPLTEGVDSEARLRGFVTELLRRAYPAKAARPTPADSQP